MSSYGHRPRDETPQRQRWREEPSPLLQKMDLLLAKFHQQEQLVRGLQDQNSAFSDELRQLRGEVQELKSKVETNAEKSISVRKKLPTHLSVSGTIACMYNV